MYQLTIWPDKGGRESVRHNDVNLSAPQYRIHAIDATKSETFPPVFGVEKSGPGLPLEGRARPGRVVVMRCGALTFGHPHTPHEPQTPLVCRMSQPRPACRGRPGRVGPAQATGAARRVVAMVAEPTTRVPSYRTTA
ncbi:hypothetical protein GCM10010341_04280 [Streptomyces noursei]|nr:hypothetical protein GCM10010341_04280 [Streptomyces noursei]